ncbi:uncharacterized protein LOC116774675 isoform X2 [Danaus plexippus]|uniref:uncharacterized protein LOC116774675 isoform X2 n=1 Tax=Danaus plexippus TaxID=13037 RepID=UPI002AB0ED0A|nr:uncharacterized protein LOC116774675 isoform X2 [Danaus plexippus]
MNFKNILSTNSVGSSVLRSFHLEDISKLQNEIELLRQNVSALKILLESRETAIGILAREKKNLYLDLTKVQRIKKKIEQQLLHERKMNSIYKECLLDAKKHILNGSEKSDTSDGVEDRGISDLKKEIKSKDQVIISVCNKYLKLKRYKRVLQDKFKTLQRNCGEFFRFVKMF